MSPKPHSWSKAEHRMNSGSSGIFPLDTQIVSNCLSHPCLYSHTQAQSLHSGAPIPHGYTSTFAQSHLLFQRPTYPHSHTGAHTQPVGTHLHIITDTLTLSPAYIFIHVGTTLISPWWLSLLPTGQVSNLDLDLTESVFGG